MSSTLQAITARLPGATTWPRPRRYIDTVLRISRELMDAEDRQVPYLFAHRVRPGILEVLVAYPSGRVTCFQHVPWWCYAKAWLYGRSKGKVAYYLGLVSQALRPITLVRGISAADQRTADLHTESGDASGFAATLERS